MPSLNCVLRAGSVVINEIFYNAVNNGVEQWVELHNKSAAPVDEQARIAAGYTEGSNVNAAEQMVSMISLARQFEMQMKVLSTADANDRAAAQILSSK